MVSRPGIKSGVLYPIRIKATQAVLLLQMRERQCGISKNLSNLFNSLRCLKSVISQKAIEVFPLLSCLS